MTNLNAEKLPAQVVEGAIQIIQTQGPTPDTPGAMGSDGGFSLCAAAALASAGLRLDGEFQRSKQFEHELALHQSADSIRQAFREMGWSQALCERSMMKNDALPAAVRQEGVIAYLRELADSV